jgi:hypothetical protein
MEFFLRPQNASIWAEVQTLAQKGDDTSLSAYVAEAQRLTTPLRNMRIATQATTLEGKSVQPGNLVVMLLVCPRKEHIGYLLPINTTCTGRSRAQPLRDSQLHRLRPAPPTRRRHHGFRPRKTPVPRQGARTHLHHQPRQARRRVEKPASRPGRDGQGQDDSGREREDVLE